MGRQKNMFNIYIIFQINSLSPSHIIFAWKFPNRVDIYQSHSVRELYDEIETQSINTRTQTATKSK